MGWPSKKTLLSQGAHTSQESRATFNEWFGRSWEPDVVWLMNRRRCNVQDAENAVQEAGRRTWNKRFSGIYFPAWPPFDAFIRKTADRIFLDEARRRRGQEPLGDEEPEAPQPPQGVLEGLLAAAGVDLRDDSGVGQRRVREIDLLRALVVSLAKLTEDEWRPFALKFDLRLETNKITDQRLAPLLGIERPDAERPEQAAGQAARLVWMAAAERLKKLLVDYFKHWKS